MEAFSKMASITWSNHHFLLKHGADHFKTLGVENNTQ